ncbi:hypothetical protein PVAP13_8NG313884 [Panicum virgatum]|uniref:Uncharacterized protein n=1 Tax=Panicum virgatum TaxID=38727 RepID=A0A8T0PAJ6_PANVG|nr:hypothetical protein PVAP13_8NG313884 [Panicum virgatum]
MGNDAVLLCCRKEDLELVDSVLESARNEYVYLPSAFVCPPEIVVCPICRLPCVGLSSVDFTRLFRLGGKQLCHLLPVIIRHLVPLAVPVEEEIWTSANPEASTKVLKFQLSNHMDVQEKIICFEEEVCTAANPEGSTQVLKFKLSTIQPYGCSG